MSGSRSYPADPSGPFDQPPQTFVDGTEREIVLERFPSEPDGDVDGLVDMYLTFDPADRAQALPPVREPEIRRWLDSILETGPDVVARHHGRIVGHATLVFDGEGGYELAIFVHQEYQGNGVGTALIRSLLGAAAADGIDRVWLTVERWNTVAINLYEAVGFEPCGRGRFELEMSLRLSGD